jgi:hypothetical protein
MSMQKTLLITGAVLGSDAVALVKPALRTALDEIDTWERVSHSTDFISPDQEKPLA